VVLVGDRGQGKSHLMAAACHVMTDPAPGHCRETRRLTSRAKLSFLRC
jgi:chromosomal replication initiation ATPase DnaA